MAWNIVWMLTRYLKTDDPLDGAIARFWVKVFALTFAVGVATGITMEFQFGMNWAAYSRFVGDIFGAPLAAEGVLAFFLESSFLGLLLFGERRVTAHSQAKEVDPAHVFAVELFKSLHVAAGSPIDEALAAREFTGYTHRRLVRHRLRHGEGRQCFHTL